MSRRDNPTQQLWLDLETTGLDPTRHCIIEMAAVLTHVDEVGHLVTDKQMDFVVKPSTNNWDIFCVKMHQKNGLVDEIEAGRCIELAEARSTLMAAVRLWGKPRAITLSGRSVHFDRMFLAAYAPELEAYLHHRHLDLSAVEMFLQHAGVSLTEPDDGSAKHRAVSDINHALAEYRIYCDLVAPLRRA